MKRGLFGLCLLAGLLLLGLSCRKTTELQIRPIAWDLEQSLASAEAGDWQKTAALTGRARAAWNAVRFRFSCLSDQDQIQQLDSLYDQLEVCRQAEDREEFQVTCLLLRRETEALRLEQRLTLWNLL